MSCQLKENKSASVHNFLKLNVRFSLFINAMPLIYIGGLEIKLIRFLILAHMNGFCKGDCCSGEVDFSTSWRGVITVMLCSLYLWIKSACIYWVGSWIRWGTGKSLPFHTIKIWSLALRCYFTELSPAYTYFLA